MAAPHDAAGLTDTDIIIDGARGYAPAIQFLSGLYRSDGVHISIISAMELIGGCRDAAALSRTDQLLRRVNILPVTDAVSQTAYHLMHAFFLSHGLLIPDALIAATALVHGMPLHTKNVRHFQMIPGLTLIRPY